MHRSVTFKDVLENEGAASILIKCLNLDSKRNLRLVCHAGKDAVDKTVTAVKNYRYFGAMPNNEAYDYAHILANSSWKGLKKLAYDTRNGKGSEPSGIAQIAEGGFSKLESLEITFIEHDASSAAQVIKAGWKIKELKTTESLPARWFAAIMKASNWPLESIDIDGFTDSIATIIGLSDWKLKELLIRCDYDEEDDDFDNFEDGGVSPEGIQLLMQGSWVSTIEKLIMDGIQIGQQGSRAIAEASHRANNLVQLRMCHCLISNEAALILGEGSYPSLIRLDLPCNSMAGSGFASILKKGPSLKDFNLYRAFSEKIDDPEDAKIVGERLRGSKKVDLDDIPLTNSSAAGLLLNLNWNTLEELFIGNSLDHKLVYDYGDEAIASLVQNEWPCLRKLGVYLVGVTVEGNKLFSTKYWPALQDLIYGVLDTGLNLEPDNMARLQKLFLRGRLKDAIAHITSQNWPLLTNLSLLGRDDDDENGDEVLGLETLQALDTSHLPSLKSLSLGTTMFSAKERAIITWTGKSIKHYKIEWIYWDF